MTRRGWVISMALAVVYGCATYTEETKEFRGLYKRGLFSEALTQLEGSKLKEQSRNRLLYLLEKGTIVDQLKREQMAQALFIEADKLGDRLFTVSVSNEALSYVYNESVQDYAGEDYERVAIHYMLALSFLEQGNLRSARVEARKINGKIDLINAKYEDKKNRYSEDAFALYLSGSIYEALGEFDDAIIDYKKAVASYENLYAREFYVTLPDQVLRSYHRLLVKRGRQEDLRTLRKQYADRVTQLDQELAAYKDSGEVLIIHEYETITPKQTNEFVIPISGQIIRFSFPIIRPRVFDHSRDFGVRVATPSSSGAGRAELLQNVDQIAGKTLEDRRLRLILKQGARLLAKGQLTEQAHRNFGPIGGIAANIYAVASETADTRCWTLLPAAFYASRMRLPKGQHTLVIPGEEKSKEIKITLNAGELRIIRAH